VVAKLRSIIGIRQIGHTGTLDPFATGLLICAMGSATKMVGMSDKVVDLLVRGRKRDVVDKIVARARDAMKS
jgi:tRNA pseudouridine55 synthase